MCGCNRRKGTAGISLGNWRLDEYERIERQSRKTAFVKIIEFRCREMVLPPTQTTLLQANSAFWDRAIVC